MGNRLHSTGRLFGKGAVDGNTQLEVIPIPQLRATLSAGDNESPNKPGSTLTGKDTVTIGDLTIFSRKILGNGFFGTVFEGWWCQKPCAVKVLSPLGQEFLTGLPITQQDNVQEEALLKFKKECDFMKDCEHPNIVTYYNTLFYPGCNLPVLVMELMQTSLRKYISEGAVMSMRTQVSLSCDIASALEFLHDRDLVHRDLCGDNVLLNRDQDIPVAKISDFGISRTIIKPEQLSHSLTALGHRPGYLPPEAFSIDPTDYDSSLDIFMFGVVMTQIASKVPTVDSSHQRQRLISQLDQDQHSLEPFISQCLSDNRKDRPSASTLYVDLLSIHESLHLKEEVPAISDAGSSRNSFNRDFNSRLWEDEVDSSTDESRECRGATPLRGTYRRSSNYSNSSSLMERGLLITEEQRQNDISSSSQYIQQGLQQLPMIRPQLYKSHSESKFQRRSRDTAGSIGHGIHVDYHPRRHSSKQKQVTSSQQRWQPIDNRQKLRFSQNTNVYQKAHSQPNVSMQGVGLDSEIPKYSRATSFQSKMKQQQKLYYERRHNSQGSHLESSDNSHVDHWTISDTEDPALRDEFPDVDGRLFEAWLNKGITGLLGMSIVANTSSQALQGIVVMEIQKGGVADENGTIKHGDMILKVNNTCVIGMSQTQVQELLVNASPNVRFVLLRQYGNGGISGAGGGAKQKLHTTTESGISLEGLPQVQAVTLYCRDKRKGFGFQIEKYEEGSGTYTVVVSNITRGGVADTSGQLKVGDQILSVDGTSTLGYAVEKARSLIRQGIAQGQVNLLIASRGGHLSPNYKFKSEGLEEWGGAEKILGRAGELALGDTRNEIKDIPEGVLLRKKKMMRSLSSHRHPDHDLCSNSWDEVDGVADDNFHVGGAVATGGGGVLKEATNDRSSYYHDHNLCEQKGHEPAWSIPDPGPKSENLYHRKSKSDFNRNGSFNLDAYIPIPSRDTREALPQVKVICLHRGPLGLGFSIVGGKGSVHGDLPIYIKQVFNEGAAGQDGRLKKDDQLLAVNGISLENVTHKFAAETLKYLQGDVKLEVISND